MRATADSYDNSRAELSDAINALRKTIIRLGVMLLVLEGVAMALVSVIAARAFGGMK